MPSADDADTLQAYLEGVDETARELEAKWGFDRLPMLVDEELRARFHRQRRKWQDAMAEAWSAERLTRPQLDAAIARSLAMKRAWQALDQAAEEAGARPVAPWVWEAVLKDGAVVAVVQTDAEASRVIAEGRHVQVYTLREVANIIDALPSVLRQAKHEFPGAKVLPAPAGDRSWLRDGDPIPFGDPAGPVSTESIS
jgi:hypothetical protein